MEELRETDHGIYANKSSTIDLQENRRKLFEDHDMKFGETGESWNDIKTRMEKVVSHIIEKYPGKTVLVVSHGFPVKVIHEILTGKQSGPTKNADPKTIYIMNSTAKSFDLHKHFVDQIKISKDGKVYTRIPEVLDCWFESGSMPYAQKHYPFENKERFEKTFPADFICEGLDQTRGWFYTLTVLAAALFDKRAFQNVIVNGIILAEDGKKMSKSLQNYPDPKELLERQGADAMRFYLMNSGAVRAEEFKFSESGVEDMTKKVILPLWNTLSFFTTYANVDQWEPSNTQVFFARHGETDMNLNKKVSDGLENSPLNETGRAQALASAERMKEE